MEDCITHLCCGVCCIRRDVKIKLPPQALSLSPCVLHFAYGGRTAACMARSGAAGERRGEVSSESPMLSAPADSNGFKHRQINSGRIHNKYLQLLDCLSEEYVESNSL